MIDDLNKSSNRSLNLFVTLTYSVCLVRFPGNASVFQCWADKACIYLFSDFFIGAFGKVSSHHIEGFGTVSLNFLYLNFP